MYDELAMAAREYKPVYVRKEEDIDSGESTFHPEMTHQIFGDSEMIFGYKGLDISLYYTAANLVPYFNISTKAKVEETYSDVPPDDISKLLAEDLPPGYLTGLDHFRQALSNEATFRPFGEMVDSYSIEARTGGTRTFEVYCMKIEEPGFRDYHSRMQTFIKFFIDAASYIDVDDERWDYFLIYEKYSESGNVRYAFSGYMTVYNFYAYPEKVRPRISQVLVLPPFQKMGLCARLIQTFYNICYNRMEVLDITVEDPSENFQRVRDFVDCSNCSKLESFQPDLLREGFSHEMVEEAQAKLKLSKLQTRRVYEILRLKATNEGNKEMFRQYRLDLKRRLNLPYLRNRKTYKKLERTLLPEELSQTLGVINNDEQRFRYLEAAFQEDLKAYKHVLERLAMV
ncbi:histone acetyltransferase type b catalytic subunit-like [Plakobranchus ocellatus]|uniref:Histone acetyltransferase type B catalytic subunit n=1 Tax=Plakobranchus ocellatus TaxID=259542 RepID=A0AAV4BLK8_9GAST|nr:histone acetyltransferase type b catalytic subunit-like [Plakobranchus ocellatus]